MPNDAADAIRSVGWDCDTIHDEQLVGAADAVIARACQTDSRVLFTIDLDFADIRAYPPSDDVGIVVLRPAKPSRRAVLRLLERALPVLTAQWTAHQLWIVEPARIRARGSE